MRVWSQRPRPIEPLRDHTPNARPKSGFHFYQDVTIHQLLNFNTKSDVTIQPLPTGPIHQAGDHTPLVNLSVAADIHVSSIVSMLV